MYELDIPILSYADIMNLIEAQPSDINSMDVEKAISNLKLHNINIQELDSLSYHFVEGDTTAVIEIQKKIQGAT